jgi:spore coat polysaccharide biosynthesis protein SpsF
MRIIATIEARMSSTRLPGKVLLPVLEKPMLHYLVSRLKMVPSLDEIVLATTVNPADDILEKFSKTENISCYRGSENDVMGRVIDAAKFANADIVVEITGDCPIIDSGIVQQAIQTYNANNVDYVSIGNVRSYPDGMDVQVFSLDTLIKSANLTKKKLDREHVTLHICNHPEIFSHLNMVAPPELYWPELGLTLDEDSDYQLLKYIIEFFQQNAMTFSCLDVIKLLQSKPDLLNINQHVERKGAT